jgi:hypothetical protein
MAPPNRKRATSLAPSANASTSPRKRSSLPARSNASTSSPKKRAAKGKVGAKTKNLVTQPLQSHGFSSQKRPQFNKGTKILLDDTIYDDGPPEEVAGYLFVYEISDFCEDGKYVIVEYKNQIIRPGGNKFRVHTEGDETQVSFEFFSLFFLHIS